MSNDCWPGFGGRREESRVTMYPWIKAVHVMAIIAWMAGMLYLPRLLVYHAGARKGSSESETFKIMERRLLKVIITPAMVGAWLSGAWLAYEAGLAKAGWFHAKLGLVVAMSALQGLFGRYVKDFAADRNTRHVGFYRVINEIPTVLMIGVVILVVVKPF